jgi:hypothetical protein
MRSTDNLFFDFQGLFHVCKETRECDAFMVCRTENITKTTLGQANKVSSYEKLCWCDEENGYEIVLQDHHCSGRLLIF